MTAGIRSRRVVAATTTTETPTPRSPFVPGAGGHRARLAVAVWVAVVAVALAWGTWGVASSGVALRAAPLYGRWRWHPGWGLVPALLAGGFVVAWGPAVARRVPWRWVPPLGGLAAVGWTLALAVADGWSTVTGPLTTHTSTSRSQLVSTTSPGSWAGSPKGWPPSRSMCRDIRRARSPSRGSWIAPAWAAPVAGGRGHRRLGGGCRRRAVAVRALVGDRVARRAAPALVVLPAAIWAGTSLDALFAGLAATGLALATVAAVRAARGRALAAGVVLGVALLFSYGAALVVVVAVVVIARARRTDRPARSPGLLVPFAVGVLLPLGAAGVIAGFWWMEGLRATEHAYWSGIGGQRPAGYLTLAGNPAALALAAGPAVAVGLAGVLTSADRRARLLPAAALGAVLVANVSQMSHGEVERIWLPFVPWLALAAPGDRRGWLAAQAGLALLVQAALASAW